MEPEEDAATARPAESISRGFAAGAADPFGRGADGVALTEDGLPASYGPP